MTDEIGVFHEFVSTAPDGPDATKLRPSDQNTRHKGSGLGLAVAHDYFAPSRVPGVTDDQPAVQAAYDEYQTVILPPDDYYFANPVLYDEGAQFIGESSRRGMLNPTGARAAVITADSCAFAPRDPLAQGIGLTIKGIGFNGGTTQVDAGLTHEVTVEDCTFRGFSKAGLCLVRGEKNKLGRLRFDFTVSSLYGLVFGYEASINYAGGLYGGVSLATTFGVDDAWVDRTEFTGPITFQAWTETWTIAAFSFRVLGLTDAHSFIFHGKGSGDGKLVQGLVRLQNSHFDTFGADSINTTGPATTGIDIVQTNNCHFDTVLPTVSGNSHFTKAITISSLGFATKFTNCDADGDNVTEFGFWFSGNVGQSLVLDDCTGAIFSDGANDLVKGQITLKGCAFPVSNLPSSSDQIVDIQNRGFSRLHMADVNGAAAATSEDGDSWAAGSGQIVTPWRGTFYGPKLNGYMEIDEITAPAAPAANKARWFVRDNGSGKTQLCVRFPTGAIQVIATEP